MRRSRAAIPLLLAVPLLLAAGPAGATGGARPGDAVAYPAARPSASLAGAEPACAAIRVSRRAPRPRLAALPCGRKGVIGYAWAAAPLR